MTLKKLLSCASFVIICLGIDYATRQTPEYRAIQLTEQANIYHHHHSPPASENQIETSKEVRFTSYYPYESKESCDITTVGLTSSDFQTNSEGWFIYEGKVVLATATELCLDVKTGACGQYNELPEGYSVHKLFDELVIEIDNKQYQAIVLDSCGACFWEEEFQRYDIFVKNKDSTIDKKGLVIDVE